MLGLAATAAAHGGTQSSEVVAVILVIIAALFWKFLLKVGIAILAVGALFVFGTILYMIVTGLQSLMH